MGVVSTSVITNNAEVVPHLAAMRFECVILDEAHRARRRRASHRSYAAAEPNNLLRFLREISPRTKSLLLATATPARLHLRRGVRSAGCLGARIAIRVRRAG